MFRREFSKRTLMTIFWVIVLVATIARFYPKKNAQIAEVEVANILIFLVFSSWVFAFIFRTPMHFPARSFRYKTDDVSFTPVVRITGAVMGIIGMVFILFGGLS